MKRIGWLLFAALAALSLAAVACGDDDDDDDDAATKPASPAATQAVDPEQLKLKIALLPVVDILPMFVAERDGYFKEEGLTVDLVVFSSAIEREAAFTSGAVDAQLTDVLTPALNNKERITAKMVRMAYVDQPDRPAFAVLASKNSGFTKPSDLAGVDIGVAKNTVTEFETEVLLRAAGVPKDQIKTIGVPQLPTRVQLLLQGELKAATLPEPFVTLAKSQGAVVIVDDRGKDLVADAITFRTDSLEKKPEGVRRFLKAYERAVVAINADPAKYEELFIEKARVPAELKGKFTVPKYPTASVPPESRVKRAVEWWIERGDISKPIAYRDLVDDSFLPKR